MQSNHRSTVTTALSRRRLLHLGGATVAGLWIAGNMSVPAGAATPNDFAGVRARWREMLIGDDALDRDMPEVRAVIDQIDSSVERLLSDMDRAAGRTFLWPDLDFTGEDLERSVDLRKTYERLRQLANAYAIPGTARYGDAEVLEAAIDGLDWMNDNKYFDGVDRYGNWYNWEIGAPRALLPATLLLLDQLDAGRVEAYMRAVDFQRPDPSGEGSNLTATCQIVAQRGALVEDTAKLGLARDALPGALRIVTEGNGFYRDGSMIQHKRHPYTGGYGQSLIAGTSRLLFILAESPWAVGGAGLETLVNWVIEGFEPWVHRGAMIGAVRGRVIARPSRPDHEVGLSGVLAMMWLAHSVDDERAKHLRGVVRHTIEDHYGNIYATTELSSIGELARIAGDDTITPAVPEIRNKQYALMDRAVHRRPGFTFALAMSSSRIYSYESINGENLRGWHTGSGMQYLYNDDVAHWENNFWATVDHTRLPGTTVPAGLREAASGANFLSGYHWAGGVAIGTRGISGLQFQTYSATDQAAAPTGRKSWFMFDDTIVAVGAFIRSSSGEVVESIAENRRVLTSSQRFTVNGTEQGAADWERTFDAGSWAHLAGEAETAGIGYVFADTVRAKRAVRTAAWSDVNQNPGELDETPVSDEYVTLWVDHGVDPTDASYAYTLLPGTTADGVARYAANPTAEVLVNTRQVQAVRSGGTLGLNVWERGAPTVEGVSCSGPACVLIDQDRDHLRIAVSDPTHNAKSVTLTLRRTTRLVSADDRITVTNTQPETVLEIDLAGSDGLAIEAEFRIGNGETGTR